MFGNGLGHSPHALEDCPGTFRIGDFEPVLLVEGDHQLKCIHGVEAQAAGTEERLFIADLVGGDLQHEVLDHHLLDVLFECPIVVHHKCC